MEATEELSNLKNPSNLKRPTEAQDIGKTTFEILRARKAHDAFEDFKEAEAESMPLCAEKCLINLIYFLTLTNKVNGDSAELAERIQQEFTLLEERIREEELTFINNTHLKHLRSLVDGNDFRTAAEKLESMLKEIRPLNRFQLRRYIAEAKRAKELMRDEEVIFLLGGTGAGKSTTIHFLAGSKMEAQEVSGLKHIHSTTTDQQLKRIGTSPYSVSETRYVHPIKIDLHKYQLSEYGKNIILCDTPGFEDTNGAEIDIANSVGICEAAQNCKSARIIILISYKSIGDRLTGIKNLAYHLVGMIKNLEKNMKAVSYIFTKFPKGEAESISTQLSDIHENLQNQEQGEDAVLKVIADMKTKTKKEAITLNPLKDNPKEILDKLLENKKKIERPDNVFTISLSQKSQVVLKNQISAFRKTINDACKRQEYTLSIYVLDQIKALMDLNSKCIQECYERSVKEIYQSLENDYSSSVSRLKLFEQFTNEDLQRFKYSLLASNGAKKFERHIDNTSPLANFKQNQSYLTYLEGEINSLMKKIENESGIAAHLILIGMRNLLKISEEFMEFARKPEEAKTKIKEKVDNFIKNFETFLSLDKFEEAAKDYSKIQEFLSVATQILGIEKDSIHKKLKHIFMGHFKKPRHEFSDLLKMDSIKRKDIQVIKDFLDKIKRAKTAFSSSEINITEEIKSFQDDLVKELREFFINLSEDAQTLLSQKENPKPFNVIQRRFEEMNVLREIPQIERCTAEEFIRIQGLIQNFVREMKKNIENLLKNGARDNIDYEELREHLECLKECQWVDKCYEGAYSKIFEDVKKLILKHLKLLESELTKLDFDANNRDNIPKAQEKIFKILSMKSLEGFIPELSDELQKLEEWFNMKIENECNSINSHFDWEETKNCKEGRYSWDSEIYQSAQKFLKTCNSGILTNTCKLQDCQKKINNFTKSYLNSLKDSAMESIAQIVEAEQINPSHFAKARRIKKSIQEIKEIQKMNDQKNSSSKSLQPIEEQLEEAYNRIEENILDKKIYKDIENNFKIAKCLKVLDPFLKEEVQFYKLAEEHEEKFKDVEDSQVKEVIDGLKSKNYRKLAQYLQKNKENISDEIFVGTIQARMQENISKKIDCINAILKNFKSNLEVEPIKEIFEVANDIKEANKYLMPYIKDVEQDINDCFGAMKKKFESSITHFLRSIEISKKLSKFSEVEEKFERLERVLECHEELLPELISKQCNDYKEEYNIFLANLPANYKSIQDLKSNDSKKVYEELEKLKDKKPQYALACKEVQGAIHNTMQDSFKKSDMTEYMDTLKYIPEELKTEVETQAKDAQNAISKLADKFNIEINRETLDPTTLENIMYECPNEIYLKKFEEEIYLKMESMKGIMNQSFKKKQLTHVIAVFENIFDLKNALKGKSNKFEIPYESCKKEIETYFQKLTSSLRDMFSELSSGPSLNHSKAKQFIQKLPDSLEIISILDQSKSSNFVQEFVPIRQKMESIHEDVARFCSGKIDTFLKCLNDNNEAMLPTIIKDMIILEEIHPLIKERAPNQSNLLEEVNSTIEKKLDLSQKTILEFDLLSLPKDLTKKAAEEKCSKLVENLDLLQEVARIRKNLNYADLLQKFSENLMKAQSRFKALISDSLQKPEEQALSAEVNRHYNNFKTVNGNLKNFKCIDLDSCNQDILNEIKKRSQEGLKLTIDQVTKCIVDIKDFAEGYLFLQEEINKKIDDFFTDYKRINGKNAISKVGALLIQHYDWKGMNITRSYKCFEGLSLSIFNDKTKIYDIDYVIDNIGGDDLVPKKLKRRYDEFIGCYEKLVKENLSKENINYEKVVSSIKTHAPKQKQLNEKIDWSEKDQQKLPSLLAHIFALWTLQNSRAYFESLEAANKNSYLLKPHPAQVVSIFRLLGIGNDSEKL